MVQSFNDQAARAADDASSIVSSNEQRDPDAIEKRPAADTSDEDIKKPDRAAVLVSEKEDATIVEGETETKDYDDVDEKDSAKFHRLSWPRLAVCLIVEAIALGALSLPKVFATLGMVPGVILTVGMGMICIYTSDIVGAACIRAKGPIHHYSDLSDRMFGPIGREITGFAFALFLTLVTGSHALTGAIALNNISNNATCSLVFSIVSAVVLFVLALPKSFHDVAILGYIDFASICVAILITMIATGVQASRADGGLAAVDWHAFPAEQPTFTQAFQAVTNIAFAYSFAICQPSFQAEMDKVKDYKKAIWTLGLTEILIYTCTGAIVYAFVGQDVQSPALLSAGPLISKIAFGIALPVIFISGSINTTTASRWIHHRIFGNTRHRYISTKKGVTAWILINLGLTILGWVVAEAVPFFSSLLGIISSLFISGFSFYLPSFLYFIILKEGKWYSSWKNIVLAVVNAAIMLIGFTILVAGTYSSVIEIKDAYAAGTVSSPYTCGSK